MVMEIVEKKNKIIACAANDQLDVEYLEQLITESNYFIFTTKSETEYYSLNLKKINGEIIELKKYDDTSCLGAY